MYGISMASEDGVLISTVQWTRKKALEGQGTQGHVCLKVTQHPDSVTVCPENCDITEQRPSRFSMKNRTVERWKEDTHGVLSESIPRSR